MDELARRIRGRALELGFDRVGFAPARLDELHRAAFRNWLEAGYHAGMEFMAQTRDHRLDPQRLLPGARSAIMLARHYPPPAPCDGPKKSAYAAGTDYHLILKDSLEQLARAANAWAPGAALLPFVDTHPVLERALAAAAGLGFVGKNSMLIHPRDGSFFFLGGILTDLLLPSEATVTENCGTCRACLDACPTEAFPEPFVLDARRCIGYLTVEHRGEFGEAQARSLGQWVFGCDVCQTVCPFNRKAMQRESQPADVGVDLAAELSRLAEGSFQQQYGRSAVSRTRRRGLIRNLLAVAENLGETAVVPVLPRFFDDHDPEVARLARLAHQQRAGVRKS